MANRTLGKYEIIDRLGRGGMAEVYRAYHAALDRYVAIKLLHPFLADDPEFKERFEGEARNIARLRHPHIVQVFDFDFDEAGESYYMVMELIEGPTLKDILFEIASAGQIIETERAIQITLQSAQALAYAHKNNMIHRDVKPANLMIDQKDNRVVLTDFGIAKIVTGAQFTASGGMVGTPAYMSPEQGMGESGDERSDLYSLGVILFQMVTGVLPFDAETPLAIILKHLNEPLPAPRKLNPQIPEWLEAIILKTLAKEPDDRFASADEFSRALESSAAPAIPQMTLINPQTTPVPPPSRPSFKTDSQETKRLDTPPDRHRTPVFDDYPVSEASITLPNPIIVDNGRSNFILIATSTLVIVGMLVMFLIVLGQGGTGPLAGVFNTEAPPLVVVPTETATEENTEAATATETPEPPTPTETPEPPSETPNSADVAANVTEEPSATPRNTPTDTPSPTATITFTPSATVNTEQTATVVRGTEIALGATATAQTLEQFFATQRAITPTPDIQRILEACDLQYAIVSPVDLNIPPLPNRFQDPRLIRAGQGWTLRIEIQNTSTCDWPAGLVFLSFVPNAGTDVSRLDDGCEDGRVFNDVNLTQPALANIRLNEAVNQGERLSLELVGVAGARFGCYFGTWEFRIPDYNLFVGDPFVIAYRAFSGD